MEVGSELLLKADGRFEYMLAYGALDELASGCWTRSGATVMLHAHKFEHSMEDPMKFERLDLRFSPAANWFGVSTPSTPAPIPASEPRVIAVSGSSKEPSRPDNAGKEPANAWLGRLCRAEPPAVVPRAPQWPPPPRPVLFWA